MAKKDTLIDKDGVEIYPQTVTDNVFDSEGNRLDNALTQINNDLSEKADKSNFNSGYTSSGDIPLPDGNVFILFICKSEYNATSIWLVDLYRNVVSPFANTPNDSLTLSGRTVHTLKGNWGDYYIITVE